MFIFHDNPSDKHCSAICLGLINTNKSLEKLKIFIVIVFLGNLFGNRLILLRKTPLPQFLAIIHPSYVTMAVAMCCCWKKYVDGD